MADIPFDSGVTFGPTLGNVNIVNLATYGQSAPTNNATGPQPPSEISGSVAGLYTPIPVIYGEARVVGRMFRWFENESFFVGIYVFCKGEIEGFQRLSIDGREVDVSTRGSSEFTETALTGANGYCQLFTGSDAQDVTAATASTRASSWTTDDYAGFACCVIDLDPNDFDMRAIPRVEAVIKGTKDIIDPRVSPSVGEYTNNPALCFAHFLTTYFDDTTDFDGASLALVADRADGIGTANEIQSSPSLPTRHTWGMVIGQKIQPMAIVVEFLESAAELYAWEEAGVWYFISDGPTASTHTIDEDRIIKGSATFTALGQDNQPDDVRVVYQPLTDKGVGIVEALGTVSGGIAEYNAIWINNEFEALRLAYKKYNRLNNENFVLTFDYFSEGLKIRRGEVFTYTDRTFGITSMDFRATRVELIKPGVWRVTGREYHDNTYDEAVVDDPITSIGCTPEEDEDVAIYLVWTASWEGTTDNVEWATNGPPPEVAEITLSQFQSSRGAALTLAGIPHDVGAGEVVWTNDCATRFSAQTVTVETEKGSFIVSTSGYGNDGAIATITATYNSVTYTAEATMGAQS